MKTYVSRPFAPFVWFLLLALVAVLATCPRPARAAGDLSSWSATLDDRLVDYYQDPDATPPVALPSPDDVTTGWSAEAAAIVRSALAPSAGEPFPLAAGRLRGRVQQAVVVEMAAAVRAGRVEEAKALRTCLSLPRGVSATEGALVLQAPGGDTHDAKRADAARLLAREAITWQTTRVRQLLDDSIRSTARTDTPMPGRLMERLGEALALADLPPALRRAAEIGDAPAGSADLAARLEAVRAAPWPAVSGPVAALKSDVEDRLPSLLTPEERSRRERLLLKLVEVIPREYASGVRDGQIVVPLEYREAVTFTQQARQMADELAPLWLADKTKALGPAVAALDAKLEKVDGQIAAHAAPSDVENTLGEAADVLKKQFDISLHRSGTTADIVGEVMLETRSLLNSSLGAASSGQWAEAERLRVEAYTTYDPELEARLMPRDPQLALDIERLLLDGIEQPGVKVLLDRHAPPDELEAGYVRVNEALGKAEVLLKSAISPTAAALNAGSIVLREGLEGLLVIVAIFAGLRGQENARRRRLFWLGIAASLLATAITWILSQTLLTRLHAYGEIIEAVTGLLAIGVLLLITNWLFHQVYWRQWVSTLKAQAVEGGSPWQLVTAGFLVGYREGFETVLFLQSLVLDAGGKSVSLGVTAGCVLLFLLGLAALWAGMKLPYFKILLVTALLIGVVLLTFVGGTVRAAQTIGWIPVHRLANGSWPAWLGNWLGVYNTWESIGGQVLTAAVVLGTWRVARFQATRKAKARRAKVPGRGAANVAAEHECAAVSGNAGPISGCNPAACDEAAEAESQALYQVRTPRDRVGVEEVESDAAETVNVL